MSTDAAVAFDHGLEDARCQALQARDITRLTQLLHPDFVYVHASGRTENRSEYLTSIAETHTDYSDFAHRDVSVQLLGECALVGGVLSHRKSADGHTRSLLFRYTAAWAAGDTGWQLLRWHNTKIIPLSPDPRKHI